MFIAHQMKGALRVDWLLEHPEWQFWADVYVTAYNGAMAQKQKNAQNAS